MPMKRSHVSAKSSANVLEVKQRSRTVIYLRETKFLCHETNREFESRHPLASPWAIAPGAGKSSSWVHLFRGAPQYAGVGVGIQEGIVDGEGGLHALGHRADD